MSAPQLPQVVVDGDWFQPEIFYPVSTAARRSCIESSSPSYYPHETGTSPLQSAKSSFSLNPAIRDDVQYQPILPAVEDHSIALLLEPPTRSMTSIPVATPDNDFLGFCKGAWKLQNGDQKGSMKKCSEADAWSRNASRAKPGHAQ